MNNQFEAEIQSREELKKERQENQSYKKIEQEILNSRDYAINDRAQELIAGLAFEQSKSEEEVMLSVLERFNREQGALPGKLGQEYINILFSAENISRRMKESGNNFHETIANIAVAAKEKKIYLDAEEINRAVALAMNILDKAA